MGPPPPAPMGDTATAINSEIIPEAINLAPSSTIASYFLLTEHIVRSDSINALRITRWRGKWAIINHHVSSNSPHKTIIVQTNCKIRLKPE